MSSIRTETIILEKGDTGVLMCPSVYSLLLHHQFNESILKTEHMTFISYVQLIVLHTIHFECCIAQLSKYMQCIDFFQVPLHCILKDMKMQVFLLILCSGIASDLYI